MADAALGLNSVGSQQLTVSTSAVSLTMPTSTRPKHATISIGSNPVRYLATGTAPTSTTGTPLVAGAYLNCMDPNIDYFGFLKTVQFIRSGGADATLDIEYFS